MAGQRPLLLIATPCFGGVVTQRYMMSILKLLEYSATAEFKAVIALLGYDSLIPRSRSTLLSAFLEHEAATHLLFIDSDIAFEPEQITRMLSFDRDFVAAMYPLKVMDWDKLEPAARGNGRETLEEAALRYVGTLCEEDELEIDEGFATAIYAGGGFQLIKRSVIARMIEAYPETRYRSIHAFGRSENQAADSRYALFDCFIDPETGVYLSEDYAFCIRWRRLGGKIWLDLHSRLVHVGSHDFTGNAAARFGDKLELHESLAS